jgi:hypothetical protein
MYYSLLIIIALYSRSAIYMLVDSGMLAVSWTFVVWLNEFLHLKQETSDLNIQNRS